MQKLCGYSKLFSIGLKSFIELQLFSWEYGRYNEISKVYKI